MAFSLAVLFCPQLLPDQLVLLLEHLLEQKTLNPRTLQSLERTYHLPQQDAEVTRNTLSLNSEALAVVKNGGPTASQTVGTALSVSGALCCVLCAVSEEQSFQPSGSCSPGRTNQ